MNEKNKHGGDRLDSQMIKKHADQWCRDNGYPIQRKKYAAKRKWTPKKHEKI